MTELRIHTYTAAEPGLFVNSYLVETAGGVVLVDANLLVSDAQALAARLGALHKPLLAAFVTHAHPDHFNGLPYIAGEDVPVYASEAVAAEIARSAEPKRAQWGPLYGEEWPDHHRVPTSTPPGSIELDGLRIEVHDLGAGESHADSYLVVHSGAEHATFIGDLAFAGVHSYTADGHTGAWLANLDRLEVRLAGLRLYPGHGAPGDVGLLADQRRYLLMYREVVRRLAGGAPSLGEEAKQELTEAMTRFLPGAPLAWLVGHGADAVAAELAVEPAPAAG